MLTEMIEELAHLGSDRFSIGGSRIMPVDEPEAPKVKSRTRPLPIETCRKLRGIIEVLKMGEADCTMIRENVPALETLGQFYNVLIIAREIGIGIYENDVVVHRKKDGRESKRRHTLYGIDGYVEADRILRRYEQQAQARAEAEQAQEECAA